VSDDRSNVSGRSRGYRHGELVVGRLEEHGAAPYQFQRDQGLSYYVKIITNSGPRTLWGTDLARAITKSVTNAKIGDLVGARSTGADIVRIPGGPPSSGAPERTLRRNRWVIEQIRFFADRARRARLARDEHNDVRAAIAARPELKSGFLTMRAAREFAERTISNAEDRERFVQGVQSAIDGSILKGTPLPSVRMGDDPTKSPSAAKSPGRDRSRTR
jgi:hypothetical protein